MQSRHQHAMVIRQRNKIWIAHGFHKVKSGLLDGAEEVIRWHLSGAKLVQGRAHSQHVSACAAADLIRRVVMNESQVQRLCPLPHHLGCAQHRSVLLLEHSQHFIRGLHARAGAHAVVVVHRRRSKRMGREGMRSPVVFCVFPEKQRLFRAVVHQILLEVSTQVFALEHSFKSQEAFHAVGVADGVAHLDGGRAFLEAFDHAVARPVGSTPCGCRHRGSIFSSSPTTRGERRRCGEPCEGVVVVALLLVRSERLLRGRSVCGLSFRVGIDKLQRDLVI
mmetsp:Transcript_64244/g.113499  ORF Transcript_64244/g.113499 Transcript_64244/m.113499 type:complete len:278 (+) Transcript_64244:2401-3234(+)